MKFLLAASLVGLTSLASPVDVGRVDGKAPTKDDLKLPKSADGLQKVGLKAEAGGRANPGEKRTLYVLVCPAGVPELVGTWWVQGEASRDGDGFTADAQFGEEASGVGEVFAVVGVASDEKWQPGDKLTELPKAAAYSKVKFAKRTE